MGGVVAPLPGAEAEEVAAFFAALAAAFFAAMDPRPPPPFEGSFGSAAEEAPVLSLSLALFFPPRVFPPFFPFVGVAAPDRSPPAVVGVDAADADVDDEMR